MFVVVAVYGQAVFHQCGRKATWEPQNTFPILDGNAVQVLLNTTKNGKLFEVTVPQNGTNTTSSFFVVHVWGTAYEKGEAQGQLLGTRMMQFMQDTWTYLEDQIENGINQYASLPKWLEKMVRVSCCFCIFAIYLFHFRPEHVPRHAKKRLRTLVWKLRSTRQNWSRNPIRVENHNDARVCHRLFLDHSILGRRVFLRRTSRSVQLDKRPGRLLSRCCSRAHVGRPHAGTLQVRHLFVIVKLFTMIIPFAPVCSEVLLFDRFDFRIKLIFLRFSLSMGKIDAERSHVAASRFGKSVSIFHRFRRGVS